MPSWLNPSAFFKRKESCVNTLSFDFGYQCPPLTFVDSHIRREVSNIVEDIIEPYKFPEEVGFQGVYPYQYRNIKANTLTLKDILIDAFMGDNKVISKLRFSNEMADGIYFVNVVPNKEGLLDFGEYKGIKPEKSLVFESFFNKDEVDLVRKNICLFWNVYEKMLRGDRLDQKSIFKMNGFHALFTEPRDGESSKIAEENFQLLRDNVRDVTNSTCGIIDAKDSMEVYGGSEIAVMNQALASRVSFIYSEIARIYKVPKARLLGSSPSGLNATGEYDFLNYEKTLNRYRHNSVDPFLLQMDIIHTKSESADIDKLKKIADMVYDYDLDDCEGTLGKKLSEKMDGMLNL